MSVCDNFPGLSLSEIPVGNQDLIRRGAAVFIYKQSLIVLYRSKRSVGQHYLRH